MGVGWGSVKELKGRFKRTLATIPKPQSHQAVNTGNKGAKVRKDTLCFKGVRAGGHCPSQRVFNSKSFQQQSAQDPSLFGYSTAFRLSPWDLSALCCGDVRRRCCKGICLLSLMLLCRVCSRQRGGGADVAVRGSEAF